MIPTAPIRSGTGSRAVARRRRCPPPGQPGLRWPARGGEWEDTASRLLYSPPGPPRQAGRTVAGHRAQIISAALAAVALLAGLVTAWAAFGGHGAAAPGARLAGRQTAATRQASPPPRSPTAPSPSATAAPSPSVPAPGGTPAMVTMAPGLSQVPDAAQVDGFLVSYFTAINTRDYQQYARLLVPARRAQLTAAAFARGYGTTTDTGASLVGISPTGRGVAATVTFTSEQRAAPGADVTGCTYWDITLYLQRQGWRPADRQPAGRLPRLPPLLPLTHAPGGNGGSGGGGDAGGGAVQDQFDGDLHLLLGIEAVGAGERLPEPPVLAALQDGAEEGTDGGSDLLIGLPES